MSHRRSPCPHELSHLGCGDWVPRCCQQRARRRGYSDGVGSFKADQLVAGPLQQRPLGLYNRILSARFAIVIVELKDPQLLTDVQGRPPLLRPCTGSTMPRSPNMSRIEPPVESATSRGGAWL